MRPIGKGGGFPGDSVVKNPPAHAGNMGSIPISGRSAGGGNGNPLQYSCLENLMERGAWWATVHEVVKSWTWMSDWACIHAILQTCSRCLLCAGDEDQEDLGSGLACLLEFLGSQATHTKEFCGLFALWPVGALLALKLCFAFWSWLSHSLAFSL